MLVSLQCQRQSDCLKHDVGICPACAANRCPLDPACPLCLQYGQIDIDSSLVASVDKVEDSGQVGCSHQAALLSPSALQKALSRCS